MSVREMSPAQIRHEGIVALAERLGPAGALAFLRQFSLVAGDYTAGRDRSLDGLTLDDILSELRCSDSSETNAP